MINDSWWVIGSLSNTFLKTKKEGKLLSDKNNFPYRTDSPRAGKKNWDWFCHQITIVHRMTTQEKQNKLVVLPSDNNSPWTNYPRETEPVRWFWIRKQHSIMDWLFKRKPSEQCALKNLLHFNNLLKRKANRNTSSCAWGKGVGKLNENLLASACHPHWAAYFILKVMITIVRIMIMITITKLIIMIITIITTITTTKKSVLVWPLPCRKYSPPIRAEFLIDRSGWYITIIWFMPKKWLIKMIKKNSSAIR